MNPTLDAYNIDDLRRQAKKRLPRGIFEYVDRGAEDEVALRHNTEIYRSLKIKNRVLMNVSERTTETEIFGRKLSMPFGISPTASAGLVCEGGEVGLARAAARMGVVCTAATSALTSMEEIHEAGDENLWFQLYMWTDMDLTARFVERIKSAGYNTMLITVDAPVNSNREYNYHTGFAMPLRYSPRLISQILANPGWCLRVLAPQYLKRGHFRKVNNPPELASKLTQTEVESSYTKPAAQDWSNVKRIRAMWPGNLLVKGLQSAEDAVIAADIGLQGVVLSNHGGRYLDSAPAPLEVIPEVRGAVGDRIKILIDSGARRGGAIVKAIALGADMVMSGRPTLYGSAVAGEVGSYRALEIFKTEMDRVMAQIGVNRIEELGPRIFWNPPDWVPKPNLN